MTIETEVIGPLSRFSYQDSSLSLKSNILTDPSKPPVTMKPSCFAWMYVIACVNDWVAVDVICWEAYKADIKYM